MLSPLRSNALFGLALGFAAALCAAPSHAQDPDVSTEMQCLRYLQSYERAYNIPAGLLTAISLAEAGRRPAEGMPLVAWPWTINVAGQGRFFDTKEQAVAETRKLLDAGQKSIDIGCMQINLRYHPNAFRNMDDAFDPATNVAYGAQFLNSLHQVQGSWSKAVERYHSSEDGRREEYRDRVLALWNSDVRNIVMNAVLAESTDTPYHHALNAFAAGHYDDALGKYTDLIKANPKDRLGLLGLAMSYEKLDKPAEADAAYAKYIVADPDNEQVLARMIVAAKALPPAEGRAKLEALNKGGVDRPELLAALAEITAAAGDTEAAFGYARSAVEKAPGVLMYSLNAAILADRLKRPTVAVRYYNDFLDMFDRKPVILETPVEGIRNRVQYLRARG